MEGMNSPYSSYRPGAIHPILHIVQVQFVLFFESSWCKTASAAKGLNQFCPRAAATTFAFSYIGFFLCAV